MALCHSHDISLHSFHSMQNCRLLYPQIPQHRKRLRRLLLFQPAAPFSKSQYQRWLSAIHLALFRRFVFAFFHHQQNLPYYHHHQNLPYSLQSQIFTDVETLKVNLNQLFLLVNGSLVILMQVPLKTENTQTQTCIWIFVYVNGHLLTFYA